MLTRARLVVLVGAFGLLACPIDSAVGGQFACSSSADCADGYVCDLAASACVASSGGGAGGSSSGGGTAGGGGGGAAGGAGGGMAGGAGGGTAGGAGGGTVVAQGTPEEVAANPASHTGRYLRPHLSVRAAA